jgi:hypothetical protein
MSETFGRTTRTALAALIAAGLLMGMGAPPATATTCTSTTGIPCVRDFAGQSSWGFDGRVRTMLRVGDVVYLGGRFTNADLVNPDGSVAQTVERDHLAALDVSTGALLDWAPQIIASGSENGDIYSLTSYADAQSGSTWVIAAGDFTSVATTTNGSQYATAARNHVAAFEADTFGTLTAFSPDVGRRPRTLLVSGNTLFLGGSFSKVNSQSRGGLAAVTLPTGTLTGWAPQAAGGVDQLAMLADGNVAIGGEFTSVTDGVLTTTTPYLAVVTQAGSLVWTAASVAPAAKVLCVSTNGDTVFLGEGLNGNAIAAYNGSTGAVLWQKSTNGDVQAIGYAGGEVIAGGHFGKVLGQNGTNVKIKKLAALDPATGLVDTAWRPAPTPATSLGVWGITGPGPGNADKLFIGGDFTGLKQFPSWRFGQYSVPGGS